ncbi:DUF3071 domain-containing protein [Serinibacter arcticus]|uniref:DUF3071 domain-containing protein n=1 Tax=Serinibacter arcticus TaxID=1655435 RepID=A0A2U1ZSB8_9MICO|nr:septation protein SepH [Serinibacter arcticus]PWD49833.1 DUF3071 domain-containing protein [Serinibacter arcticus]
MVELELDSLHADGEHLILRGPDGQRYRLVIDEALRIAVRRDRPHLEALRAQEASTLRPRDIQSRIRAGASAEAVAAEGGLTVESVRRYEGPVQAERSWIAEQTRALPIGREVGAPTLGDLVMDRLAARGVTTDATWDAVRRPGEPWEVAVTFDAAGSARAAHWQVDLTTRSLVALDDESRWLSETELTGSRRPGRGRPFDVEHEDDARRAPDVVILDSRTTGGGERDGAAEPSPAPHEPAAATAARTDGSGDADEEPQDQQSSPAATEALLDRLDATRGVRSSRPVAGAGSDDAEPETSTGRQGRGGAVDDALFPVAPVLRLRQQAGPPADGEAEPAPSDSADDAAPDQATEPEPAARPARTARKARRTSIPSWDEIVFGAKQD